MSTSARYDFEQVLILLRQVLDGQVETNRQLAVMNGRTRHLEEREEAHSQHLGSLDMQVVELEKEQAAAAVWDKVHSKELGWTRDKVLDLSKKVGTVILILVTVLKLYAPDLAKLADWLK